MFRARRKARAQLMLMVFGDLKTLPRQDRSKYLDATKAEFDVLTSRGVLTLLNMIDLTSGTHIGSCRVLLIVKHSRKMKARCVYHGERQVA